MLCSLEPARSYSIECSTGRSIGKYQLNFMMTLSQAECLLYIVRIAELQDWQIPSGRALALYLYPDKGNIEPGTIRAANRRIESLRKYITFIGENPRRLDPESLVTEPATAHYLLVFYELRKKGPVSKEQLHQTLLSSEAQYHYNETYLEALYDYACRTRYITPPAPTTPEKLHIGHALQEHLPYLKLLRDS